MKGKSGLNVNLELIIKIMSRRKSKKRIVILI
jgi:hypothetical protein